MAEIKANSVDLINCGDKIMELSKEFSTTINEFYEKFSKINTTAWSGASAEKYVSKVSADKLQYDHFSQYLYSYGKVIKNIGANIDLIVNKWEEKGKDV